MGLVKVILYTLVVMSVVILFGMPLASGLGVVKAFFTLEGPQFRDYIEGER